MFRNPLFRERALIRNAQPEPLDGLLRVTAPHEWLLVACLAAIVVGVPVWGAFATVERTVSGDGAVVHPGPRHAIVAAVSGVVAEVTAHVGDRIEAGQTIARLELPELAWRLRIARARVALLEERARTPGAGSQPWLDAELATARAEVLELVALDTAGAVVVSPRTGELTAHGLVEGQTVDAGQSVAEVRTDIRRAPEAILFVTPEQGGRIHAGMKARIVVGDRFGARTFAGEVAEVSPPLPELPFWLSRMEFASPEATDSPGHLVRLAVPGAEGGRIPDGARCRVEIVVARHSPLGLLLATGGRPR